MRQSEPTLLRMRSGQFSSSTKRWLSAADPPVSHYECRHGLGVRRRDPRPVLLLSADNQAQVDLSSLRLHNPIIFTPDLSCLSPAAEEDGPKGRKRKWEVVQCRAAGDGRRCDLKDCLQRLWRMGYRRLMVEGTQAILTCHVHKGEEGRRAGGSPYVCYGRAVRFLRGRAADVQEKSYPQKERSAWLRRRRLMFRPHGSDAYCDAAGSCGLLNRWCGRHLGLCIGRPRGRSGGLPVPQVSGRLPDLPAGTGSQYSFPHNDSLKIVSDRWIAS